MKPTDFGPLQIREFLAAVDLNLSEHARLEIGDPGRIRDNLLDLVELLFGELARAGAARRLR
jgi:hypothetical protein